jgi:6-pyruvoyltetrahydropterin/6-carboxytetrahydropterin synthase
VIQRISKTYRFEASHQLPWHMGKCARLHGHSYVLEVVVAGVVQPDESGPSSGMVVDFADLDQVVKPLVARMDHHHLNQLVLNPTAERLLEWILAQLSRGGVEPTVVRLWETANCYAEWNAEDQR